MVLVPDFGAPAVVALGGGHGLAAALRGIRTYAGDVTAIVTVADDGGSSGRLRRDLGGLAPGDVRRCLVALADDPTWAAAFEHRFAGGELDGHALGNLVVVGLAETLGDFTAGLDAAAALLHAAGRVLPATVEPVILKAVVAEESPEVVIIGKQAIDGDNNAVGQMLAALLDWPQATFASAVEIGGGKAKVSREVDGGLQTLEVDLPAVITVDLRLNEPRYASLPNIMKAKKKPLDVKELASLGADTAPRLKVLKVTEPPKRAGGVKVESAADLVSKLKNEAGVL